MKKFRLRSFFILLTVFVGIAHPVFGQSFGIAPSESGQINPSLEFDWKYSESSFGGAVSISIENESITSEKPLISNYDTSITTVSQSIFADINVLTYTFGFDQVNIIPGIGIQYDYYDIQEVGFFDYDASTRIFLNNDRFIHALRPGFALGFTGEGNGFEAQLSGFYAPIFLISLEQTFSSASADNVTYDTPKTTHSFQGAGMHAWGANAGVSYKSEGFIAGVKADFNGFDIKYDFISFGANSFTSNTTSINGKIELTVGTPLFEYNGIMPMLGGGFKVDFSKDNSNPNSEWVSKQQPLYLTIGFQVLDK